MSDSRASRRIATVPVLFSLVTVGLLTCVWSCDAPQANQRPTPLAPPDDGQGDGETGQAHGDTDTDGESIAPASGANHGAVEGADGPLSINRKYCSRAGCELTFTFSRPMVRGPRAGLSRAVRMSFSPNQPGTFRWTSPTELVFKPKPGSLVWGHKVTIEVAAATALDGKTLAEPWRNQLLVPYFEAAGKVAYWPVIAGRPRFVAFLKHRSDLLGKAPIYLLYDQPVSARDVAGLTRLTTGRNSSERAFPVRVTRPKNLAGVWDGPLNMRHVVAIQARELPVHGERVTLQYPKQLHGGAPAIDKREFYAHTEFNLDNIQIDNQTDEGRVPLHSQLRLNFTSPVTAADVQRALTIEPRPSDFGVSWMWNTEAVVYASLQPGVSYRMSVSPKLTDQLGNQLGERHSVRFVAHDLPPSMDVPREPMVLERGHAQVPTRSRNVANLQAQLHTVDSVAEFVRMLQAGPKSCAKLRAGTDAPVRRAGKWNFADKDRLNQMHEQPVALAKSGKRTALGCLHVSADGTGSRRDGRVQADVLVQQTGLGVIAKVHDRGIDVWAANLADAQPAAGARVALLGQDGATIAQGVADEHGLVTLAGADITSRASLVKSAFVSVETADDAAVATLTAERLAQPWQYGMRGTVDDAADLSASVFTDRGVYRPAETVHVKVIARDLETGRIPATGDIDVVVSDPRGQDVKRQRLNLDTYGGAHMDVALADGASVGRYTVHVSQGDMHKNYHFQVEEYRVPTFQVAVKTDQPWTAGDAQRATVQARYLHGGELAARPLRYTVSRERVPFSPRGFPGFVFQAPQRDSVRSLDGILKTGSVQLDGQGKHALELTTAHPSQIGPMRYVVDAAVTDVDRQTYKGRLSRVVHPADVYVGVRPSVSGVLAAGDVLDVPVVAVAPNGLARSGVRAKLELIQVDHHTTARLARTRSGKSVEMANRAVRKVVDSCSVKTRKRAVTCRLRVRRAGSYQLVASARDSADRLTQSGYAFTASGKHSIAWPRYAHERIDVITDKTRYQSGDVARLMVKSPFGRARGLLTLERGGVIERRFFDIAGDSPVIEVPIADDHAPNLYASVTLIRPRVHDQKDATGFQTGAPSIRMGYAELAVTPRAQKLQVSVSAAGKAAPGERYAVDIAVADVDGAPRAGQATVMVVDEAVLGLTGYKTPDPVADVFAARPLGVRTLASILDLPHSRRARHEQIMPGGDGGPGFGLSDMAQEMRSLFQSTAYWNPSVPVGADGRARVEFDLPDGVTTYRIMAVVNGKRITSGPRTWAPAGSADGRVVVNKPLMVQPVMPRFAYPEDTLRVEARVFNTTDQPARVRVVADLDGLRASRGERVATGPFEVTVPAGDSRTVGLPAIVTGREKVRVRFSAQVVDRSGDRRSGDRRSGDRRSAYRDAVEHTIPVLNPGSRRRVIEKRSVLGQAKLAIELPEQRIPGTESLEIRVSQSRLSQLKESVDYLMGYPNGCIEQTTSRAYPLLVLRDLLPEMGVTVDEAKLKDYAEAGVKRLLSFQTSQGGLAYWPGSDEAHAFGTAFGGSALIEAKNRGFDVPDAALDKMAEYLLRSLGQDKISEEMPHGGMADADTRALFLMTLGRMGRPQPAHVSTLWRARAKLTAFGLGFLAVAAGELPSRNQGLVDEMLALVRKRAKEETDEAYFQGKADGGWSMGSPLRTHAGALLAYAVSAPGHEMQAKLLSGLLNRQRRGQWGNTQENVFGIMAVARSMQPAGQSSDGAGRPELTVRVDGQVPRSIGNMGRNGLRAVVDHEQMGGRADTASTHNIVVENRAGTPAHMTVRAEYDVKLDATTMAARDDGFALTRIYETPTGKAVDAKAIALGSLVRVRVRVETTQKHNYVAIHDLLPAGLEPLNANLATTESVRQGALTEAMTRALGVLSYSEIRDSRVAFYANDLPRGIYEFSYLARATTPGTFLRPAAVAEAMYQPDASGASQADYVAIQ